MKAIKINTSELKEGLIRQVVLPKGFIERVQKFKEILKEVETMSPEEAVSNFQRDILPEKELLIWETIAYLYQTKLNENPNLTIQEKKRVFGEILKSTF